MIHRVNLTSAIDKYHLSGMNEAVIWDIKDNVLTVKFTSPNKEMLGYIKYSGFPLEDSKIGISNTSQLNKLIEIAGGALDLKYLKHKDTPHKLIISDKSFTLNYSLADLMVIPKPGDVIGDIQFDIKAPLDSESISSIVKAKKAVGENDVVVIKPSTSADDEFIIELEFGGNVEHANKVSFYLSNIKSNIPEDTQFKVQYNSDMIKEIMYANKNMESGYMSISLKGVMKLEFYSGDETLESVYYLVARES